VFARIACNTLIFLQCCIPWCSSTGLRAEDRTVGESAPSARSIDFESQILPVLKAHCFECHGEDTQESHLRVDRRSSLLRGGDSGEPAMVPGNADASHLIQLIAGNDRSKMMPPEGQSPLSMDEVQLLRDWIDQGALWPGAEEEPTDHTLSTNHWSFQPLSSVSVPSITDPWIHNDIDAFILQKLHAAGLQPNPPASRRDLMRRLSLDVIGLPATPDVIHQFEQTAEGASAAATAADHEAWSDMVNSMLASPHYGERWAQYWLDLVRFGETNGFETNRERPHAWPYRDYVIRSLNDDKPYDQFLKEQLAGDVLGVPQATGYLVAGSCDIVKSPDPALTMMQRQNELDDIIGTTGSAFLGLTLGCARCHNHKFDPIRQTDYYAVQAVFAGVQHGDQELPHSPETRQQIEALEAEIRELRERLRPFAVHPEAIRPAVTAAFNEELLTPVMARWIRFTILQTNSGEPCLDELEVFSGATNVALSSAGATSSSSGNLAGFEIHQLKHINDGLLGNAHSWISSEPGKGWVQIELPSVTTIDRIVWARDRKGNFADRLATEYRIETATQPGQWQTVASSETRQRLKDGRPVEPQYRFDGVSEELAGQGRAWLQQLTETEQRRSELNKKRLLYAGKFVEPGPTFRLFRGDPMAPREQVAPDTVAILGKLPLAVTSPEQQRRLALAEWIVSPKNPLTARVIVNRIWMHHFGRGLVVTPSDFGAGGVPPTHPELLDWLAQQLMQQNWSLKHIHRLILTSSTWRQSSAPRADALQADGSTQWLWRFPPRRLDAEAIRDSILTVTGALNLQTTGPGFSAFEVQLENVRHYFPRQSFGPPEWRRMVYMTRVRQQRDAVFGAFDCPDAASSVSARTRSTTPLQALNLFNSDFMLQQSELFSERLQRETPNGVAAQIRRSFELCYGRTPDPSESQESTAFISEYGLSAFCRILLNSNEFLFLP
jgi:hypothetical protein